MKKFRLLLAALLLFAGNVLEAQTSTVIGTVIDAADGTPMIGVTAVIKGTRTGVSTDINGKYEIKNVPPASTLVFQFIGYISQEVLVGSRSVIDIRLERDAIALEEVVITGYGVTTKKAFTGAATGVNKENISNKFEPNPIKNLQGVVPGLQMNTGSGQPGAPSTVFIRGRNSLNSGTQPLYVIDGVPMESDSHGIRSSERQEVSALSAISSEDIESITVLKDATATSIYGARAANGVIVITTKRGKKGFSVNFSAKAGVEAMPNYPKGYKSLNRDQYLEISKEALMNAHTYAAGLGKTSYFDYYNNAYQLGLPYTDAGALEFLGWYSGLDVSETNTNNTDWMKEVTRKGVIQNYSVEILGGGTEESSAKYFVSLDFLDNKAIVRGKDLSRYSFRFNFDQQPTKVIKFGFNSNLSYSVINMGAGGGYFSDPITQAVMQSPLSAVKNADGNWNFATINGYNPVAQRSKLGDKSTAKQYRALLSPYLQINFTKDLYLLSRVGVDAFILDEFGYWSFLQPQGSSMKGMGENAYTANILLTTTNTLNYIKQFGQNNVNILLGQEGQRTNYKTSYLSGSNYPVDYLNEVTNTSTPGSASTDQRSLILNSFFSRAEYSYANKYYLSGSFRYDASSRFGSNNRWAPFWSFGAKYRLTNENFMSGTANWLSDATVRASYGTSGNQQVGSGWFASRDLYNFGYNYNSLPGSGRLQLGNPDLRWEQTKKFNVGVDLSLFKRINITADYYNHKTTDMVFAVPISRTTGMSLFYQNIGALSNKGFEVSISGDIIQKEDLTWTVTLNGSKNINTVEKLSTDLPITGTTTIIEPGKDIYTFKMKEWAGVDPQTGIGLWYKNETGDETTSNYNLASKRYVGKASPDFQGGMTSTFKWKGFDFGFQMNYSLGGKIYGNNLRYDEHLGMSLGENIRSYVYDNRWKKPGDIAKVPMVAFMSGRSENSHSTRFLMDASYLKIRSINLGYSLPKDWVKGLGMQSFRISLNADNVYTFSNKDYRGFDPSGIDATGVQWWNYPIPRNIMLGISVGF